MMMKKIKQAMTEAVWQAFGTPRLTRGGWGKSMMCLIRVHDDLIGDNVK